MEKSNENIKWIVILIIGVLAIYGFQAGWFKGLFSASEVYPLPYPISPGDNSNNNPSEKCTLSLTPQIIFSGDSVTGIVQDGVNTKCDVYATDGSGWRLVYTGFTDSTGRLSATQTLDAIGTFQFRAICGSCSTNEVTLQVNLPSGDGSSDEESWCYDSDDGSESYNIQGYCEDSFSSVGYLDSCEDGLNKEWYCGTDNHCYYAKFDCSPGSCYNGRCVYQACSSIGRPISQASCDKGMCNSGTCTFYPATLTMSARCGCS